MRGKEAMMTNLRQVIGQWAAIKQKVDDLMPLDNAILHLVAGLLIYLIVSRIAPCDRRSGWHSWLTVLVLAMLNEASDLLIERWPDPGMQYVESITDLGWTLALPTVLVVASIIGARRRVARAR